MKSNPTLITPSKFRAFLLVAAVAAALPCGAQQMPQNYWRHDGTHFGSGGATMRSIAIGTGGVYVGLTGGNVDHFTEAGGFVNEFFTTFSYILGIACDPAGNVYVLDRTTSGSCVFKFDSLGNPLANWGSHGTGDGQFNLTGSTGTNMIATDKTGLVYVCDPGNNRIQVFNGSGVFQRKWGEAGTLPGQFAANKPTEICVSNDNRVYASTGKIFDTSGNYLTMYYSVASPYGVYAVASDGMFLTNYGGWSFGHPSGITGSAYDGSLFTPTATISAASAFSKRGDLYTVTGSNVFVFKREYRDSPGFPAPPAIPQPIVVAAAQRPATSLMDIDYQITDTDSPTVSTGLLAFKTGGFYLGQVVVPRSFVEGTSANLGDNQPRDTVLRVTWDMAADGLADTNLAMEVLAKDTRNLLGVHWINVPASGGDPAFRGSYAPIADTQLHDLWLWFAAARQEVSLTTSSDTNTATVTGTTGTYAGRVLATSNTSNTTTTSIGRMFAYERMGVRPISGAELARAQAGNYGFSSLSGNTVVKVESTLSSYLEGWGTNSLGESNWFAFYAPAVVEVACGGNHNLLLMSDASLWAVGYNGYGQLGDGTTTNRSTPVRVATGVTKIAASGNHSLFVKNDGTLWAMGYNGYGQLGDGTTTTRTSPVQVPGAAGVLQIAAGYNHSLFVKPDMTVGAMGYNGYGQLGDGTTTQRNSPVSVTGVSGVTAVAAGDNHSVFLLTDGTLRAVGSNGNGQLGDSTTTNRSTSVAVVGASSVTQIAAGGSHSLFVTSFGALYASGANSNGQLGDGTTTQRTSPVLVPGVSNVSKVAAGDSHSVFLKSDTTLWTMGYNNYGQLGDGTTTQRNSPVQTASNVSLIGARLNHTCAIVTP